jgi:hypothetical protein
MRACGVRMSTSLPRFTGTTDMKGIAVKKDISTQRKQARVPGRSFYTSAQPSLLNICPTTGGSCETPGKFKHTSGD